MGIYVVYFNVTLRSHSGIPNELSFRQVSFQLLNLCKVKIGRGLVKSKIIMDAS